MPSKETQRPPGGLRATPRGRVGKCQASGGMSPSCFLVLPSFTWEVGKSFVSTCQSWNTWWQHNLHSVYKQRWATPHLPCLQVKTPTPTSEISLPELHSPPRSALLLFTFSLLVLSWLNPIPPSRGEAPKKTFWTLPTFFPCPQAKTRCLLHSHGPVCPIPFSCPSSPLDYTPTMAQTLPAPCVL